MRYPSAAVTDAARSPLALLPAIASAHESIGGMPIPPPTRSTRFPAVSSIGNPFPSGPITEMESPAESPENSRVPLPAMRYTSRICPAFASTLQMEMGLGSSLLSSLLNRLTNCPALTSEAKLTFRIRLRMSSVSCSEDTTRALSFTFISVPLPMTARCPPSWRVRLPWPHPHSLPRRTRHKRCPARRR